MVLAAGRPMMIPPVVIESPPNIVELTAIVSPPLLDEILETACLLPTRLRTRPITLQPAGTPPSKIACTKPSALRPKIARVLLNNLCSQTRLDPRLKSPAIDFHLRQD